MALNGNDLGTALDIATASFNNVTIDTTDPAAMAAYRLNYWQAVGNAIVTYIKAHGVLNVPGTGLAAPSGGGPVTGTSNTGTIS